MNDASSSGDDFFDVFGDNTSQYYVNQAYVQYLAPITSNGILIKAGKFGTLIGAEVAQTTANFNITRGNVYNLLQPIDHVGVLASTDIGETGFSAAFGVLNDIGTGDPDFNDAKSITAQVAWAGETVSLANTLVWGPPHVGINDNSAGIYDVLVDLGSDGESLDVAQLRLRLGEDGRGPEAARLGRGDGSALRHHRTHGHRRPLRVRRG